MGWWPRKYVILMDYDDSEIGCKEAMLEWYDLVKVYETPLKQWSYWLRFEYRDYMIYQMKGTNGINGKI